MKKVSLESSSHSNEMLIVVLKYWKTMDSSNLTPVSPKSSIFISTPTSNFFRSLHAKRSHYEIEELSSFWKIFLLSCMRNEKSSCENSNFFILKKIWLRTSYKKLKVKIQIYAHVFVKSKVASLLRNQQIWRCLETTTDVSSCFISLWNQFCER